VTDTLYTPSSIGESLSRGDPGLQNWRKSMADEMVVEHGGHGMNGTGAWFLLFFTIVIAVIVGILALDVVNNLITQPVATS
jgi:hypothetical protein